LIKIQKRNFSTGQACKERRAKTDRAGANDENPVIPGYGPASDGMRTNRQKFNDGTLISGQPRRVDKITRRYVEQTRKTAVLMHAKHGDLYAAIRLSFPAGDTVTA
jgi:hypothetical protein